MKNTTAKNRGILKGGCLLLSADKTKLALVYRSIQNDYSFPKGHIEAGETPLEGALRETEEETGYVVRAVKTKLPILTYETAQNQPVEVHFFIAVALRKSTRPIHPSLKHTVKWVELKDVSNFLSYDNLKEYFSAVLPILEAVIKRLR